MVGKPEWIVGVQETNLVTVEHQCCVGSGMDINASIALSEISLKMLDVFMTIKEHVARLVRVICISGVVDIKDSTVASRVVCVGASEIQCLGLSH